MKCGWDYQCDLCRAVELRAARRWAYAAGVTAILALAFAVWHAC